MCDECLMELLDRLKTEEILILNVLYKHKTFNKLAAIDNIKIMADVKITPFIFNACAGRLEIAGLLNRNRDKRQNKFYITKDGRRFLDLYKESIAGLV